MAGEQKETTWPNILCVYVRACVRACVCVYELVITMEYLSLSRNSIGLHFYIEVTVVDKGNIY